MNDKNIMLQIDFPDEIYLLADKKLLEKAVENILQILNTGVWLPEGKESDLFVPFYRLENPEAMV